MCSDTALTQSASQSSQSAAHTWQCPTQLAARESAYLATPVPLAAAPIGCACRECLAAPQSFVPPPNDSGFTSGQSSDHRSAHVFPLPPTDELPADAEHSSPDPNSSGENHALTSSGRYLDEDCVPPSLLSPPANACALAGPTTSRANAAAGASAAPPPPQRNVSRAKNECAGDGLLPLPPEMPTPITCILMERSYHEAAAVERCFSDRASERSLARRAQASASVDALDSKSSSKNKLARTPEETTTREYTPPTQSLDASAGPVDVTIHSTESSDRLESSDSFEYRDMGLV